MLEIPERELRFKGAPASQRPTRASLLEELRRVPGGADPGLLECVAHGTAFHHAGEARTVAGVGLERLVGGWVEMLLCWKNEQVHCKSNQSGLTPTPAGP